MNHDQHQHPALVQKLAGAIQNLRGDRDREYRAKADAEERLRLAKEEEHALAKIVADLKTKNEKIVKTTDTFEASLGPFEDQVRDFQEKNQFQHNELIGARAKIQQKTLEMEETAREREANLRNMRELAHKRRLRLMALTQQTEKELRRLVSEEEEAHALRIQKEGLERELTCLMFEWESIPKLMKEKGRLYLAEAQRLAELNYDMARELSRRGISIPVKEGDDDQVMDDDDDPLGSTATVTSPSGTKAAP